ncbi:PREDICTED: 21 kDa protein-like [Nelumbo nucifera]|uniref:Pectinesterase inhibitor domain-containing protein n=2 Tax=Nelumbo nucifera TaxID=4432 RepID=A0A822YWK4_NELNU|nr:PREDICTED: 21 kDa protein-like [Nelumbo nucifera]DAD35729.1 TPA_asm: hypothetical protein HUJ06_006369 [Nelumbo nucifera]
MAAKPLFLHLLLPLLAVATALLLLPEISSVDAACSRKNATDFIRTSCSSTLYPDLCYTSLSRYAHYVRRSPGKLARVAIAVSLSKANRTSFYLSQLSRQAVTGGDQGAAAVLEDCLSTFGDAVDQMRSSMREMRRPRPNSRESFAYRMSNVQTWMSAALTNEDTCTDEFEDVPDGPVKSDVCNRVEYATKFTSNALALVNSYVASVTNATPCRLD